MWGCGGRYVGYFFGKKCGGIGMGFGWGFVGGLGSLKYWLRWGRRKVR